MDKWTGDWQKFGPKSYSQHGDDFALLNIFDLMGIQKPSYLDLGAHHPYLISNTALMYERGCRGINVEANPMLMDNFHVYRSEDKNLNVGVGVLRGKKEFYILEDTSGLNTFCMAELDRIGSKPTRSIMLEVVTLKHIVDEHCGGIYPDLLITDIEGMDYKVLEAEDFSKSKPKVICSEIRPHESKATSRMLAGKGFVLHSRVQANLIFIDANYLDSVF